MNTFYALGLSLLAATLAVAQTEQIVNTHRDSTQRDPDIARDAAGNAAIVWVSKNQAAAGSEGDIYVQRLAADGSPLGEETLVNTTTSGDQDRPAVAMAPSGDFIVVWASIVDKDSMYDIVARRFAGGVAVGPEFIVNTVRHHTQTCPDVAVDASGAAVVVWESWFQDGGDRGVYMRRLDPSGAFLGPEVQMNTTTAYSQARPPVAMMPGGGCVTVWESWLQESPAPSGYGLVGRLWNADGSPATNEFQINTTTVDYQWQADVQVLSDSTFTVVWCSWEQDGFDGAIMLRRFSAGACFWVREVEAADRRRRRHGVVLRQAHADLGGAEHLEHRPLHRVLGAGRVPGPRPDAAVALADQLRAGQVLAKAWPHRSRRTRSCSISAKASASRSAMALSMIAA